MITRTRCFVALTLSVAPLVLANCGAPSGGPALPAKPPVAPPGPVVPHQPGAFPGDVPPGEVRWGAAIDGNGDPARHENVTERAIGLRRTYWRWDQRTTSMRSSAAADLAAGRVPWVSVKTPGWALTASGAIDGEIDDMLRGLDSLGGPVWLTVHHEPEGGGGSPGPDDPGGASAWRAMQAHVRDRMTAVGTRNVAFAPVLMAWTFDARSHRNPLDWWVDGVWDFAGVDYYVESEAPTDLSTAGPMWGTVRSFYGARGLKVALGEWGNRGTDVRAATEMRDFYDDALRSATDGQGAQVIGFAYFDSGLNSPTGGWSLQGAPLDTFRQLVDAPTSVLATA